MLLSRERGTHALFDFLKQGTSFNYSVANELAIKASPQLTQKLALVIRRMPLGIDDNAVESLHLDATIFARLSSTAYVKVPRAPCKFYLALRYAL